MEQDSPKSKVSLLTLLAIGIVRLYQIVLSPLKYALFGPSAGCRFQPTCSCYARDAYEHHGFIRGSWLAVRRIARCHPWNAGGYDPVPSSGETKPCCLDHTFKTHTNG